MTDAVWGAWIAAGASFAVAVTSGFVSLHNRKRTDRNSFEIQDLKGSVDKDLERLKAKLSHGQSISSAQWNAEFTAYQAIWKAMVPARTVGWKLVHREDDLVGVGITEEQLNSMESFDARKEFIEKFLKASRALLSAINDSAPFYVAPIRTAANDVQLNCHALIEINLRNLYQSYKGESTAQDDNFRKESLALLGKIVKGTDLVEDLIRKRMAEVRVINVEHS